jgi:hypothetical protein
MINFFWDNHEGMHKYYLSNWYSLAQKKEHGGLGIPSFAYWHHRFRDTMMQMGDYGRKLWMLNTKLAPLTFSVVKIDKAVKWDA